MRIKWGDLKPSDRIALVGLIITAISVAIAFVQLFDPFSSGAGPPTTTAATSQNDPIAVNVKQLSQLNVCNGANGSIYSQPIAALSDYERLIDEVYVNWSFAVQPPAAVQAACTWRISAMVGVEG
jgi:hypothetical protein